MRRTFQQVAFLLLLSVAAGAATKWLHPRAPSWFLQEDPSALYQVTPEQVRERWQGDVLWIDARTPASFEENHLPGAILLNQEDWNRLIYDAFETIAAAQKPIVAYCDGARCKRSKEVADRLRTDLGLSNVYVLKGDWREFLGASE